jgi:hypothetical protein
MMGNLIVFFVSQQFYSAIWQYSRRREKSRAEHNKLWTIMILLKIWKGGHTNTITFGYHFDICAISLQVGFSKMLTPLHSRPYICRTPNAKITFFRNQNACKGVKLQLCHRCQQTLKNFRNFSAKCHSYTVCNVNDISRNRDTSEPKTGFATL